MPSKPDMKYTLYRRTRGNNGEEVAIGRSFVWLVWVILAFILIILGRSIAGFLRWSSS
jgi:hypothetical protein